MIKFFLFKCCLRAKSSCSNRTEPEKIEPMRESPAENQNKKFTVGCQIFSRFNLQSGEILDFFYVSYEILIMTVCVLSTNVI